MKKHSGDLAFSEVWKILTQSYFGWYKLQNLQCGLTFKRYKVSSKKHGQPGLFNLVKSTVQRLGSHTSWEPAVPGCVNAGNWRWETLYPGLCILYDIHTPVHQRLNRQVRREEAVQTKSRRWNKALTRHCGRIKKTQDLLIKVRFGMTGRWKIHWEEEPQRKYDKETKTR